MTYKLFSEEKLSLAAQKKKKKKKKTKYWYKVFLLKLIVRFEYEKTVSGNYLLKYF